MSRFARQVDANQSEIVEALRGVGATVLILAGTLDLAVGYRGRTVLMDCKNPKGLNRLTARQALLLEDWRGDRIAFPRTVDDALRAIGALEV